MGFSEIMNTQGKTKLLESTKEEILEPNLPICDAHHHLWEYPGYVYSGKDLLEDIASNNVLSTVFVEAWDRIVRNGKLLKDPPAQTAFAVNEGEINPGRTRIAAGIVGFVDLMRGESIAKEVESHIIAGKGRFRGIRYSINSDMASRQFAEGYSVINDNKLTLDAVVPSAEQLLNVAGLAKKFPDTPVIINHLGIDFHMSRHFNPNLSVREVRYDLNSWKKLIDKIAVCENIYMKLGGLGMDLGVAGWEKTTNPNLDELAQLLKPWYFDCIEKFGPDRCMFESNFPVDKKSFSYTTYWNAVKLLTKDFSTAERKLLFSDTAKKAYRL